MIIHIVQDQADLSIDPGSVEKVVVDFASFYSARFDEASIHFVDTRTICRLHDEFFGDPSTTDCVSFPIDAPAETGYRVLGDVVVCPKTAIDYVKAHGGDIYQELTLYVIHGLLHLLGYDDMDDEAREVMKREEARYMDHLATKSLWINLHKPL